MRAFRIGCGYISSHAIDINFPCRWWRCDVHTSADAGTPEPQAEARWSSRWLLFWVEGRMLGRHIAGQHGRMVALGGQGSWSLWLRLTCCGLLGSPKWCVDLGRSLGHAHRECFPKTFLCPPAYCPSASSGSAKKHWVLASSESDVSLVVRSEDNWSMEFLLKIPASLGQWWTWQTLVLCK